MTSRLADPDAPVPPPEPPRAGVQGWPWTVTRHADVAAVLRSPAFEVAEGAVRIGRIGARSGRCYGNLLTVLRETMVFQNAQKHQRSRSVVRDLVAAGLARWPESALWPLARDLAEAVPESGEVDVVPSLATPLPGIVLASLLGLEPDACDALRAKALTLTGAWIPAVSVRELDGHETSSAELLSTLRPYAKPGGAIDRLSTGHADDDTVGLAIFMLIAGAETITGTIAAALDILARNPGWQDQLRAEPALMPGFVRETLRLAGPLRRLTPRFAVEDVSIGGAEIRRDDLVILRTDSAHRDPAVYTDPERIDPTRKGAALLAFGGGAHICQGPLIGAAEAEVMVAAVLARFAVRPGSTRGALFAHEDWRVFETLPLTLTPVTAPDGETDR